MLSPRFFEPNNSANQDFGGTDCTKQHRVTLPHMSTRQLEIEASFATSRDNKSEAVRPAQGGKKSPEMGK